MIKPTDFDVLILGGGASGLFLAHELTQGVDANARRIGIIDHARRPGIKLALAGGGRGNVTNLDMRHDCFVGENPDFTRSALARFTPTDLLDRLDAWGLDREERDFGQIFLTGPSRSFADLLETLSRARGATFLLEHEITAARREPDEFLVTTDKGSFTARRLVIALGGPSWPQAGASGQGHALAKGFGHGIIPSRPALVPFIMPGDWPLHGLAGVSLNARVSPSPFAAPMPLLFTHQGLSGPATLMASCLWQPKMSLCIDFLPETPLDSLLARPENGRAKTKNLLRRLLPDRLADRLAPSELAERNVAELSKAARAALAAAVHTHQVIPAKSAGMSKSEAARGGVDTRNVSSRDMQSTLVPGLYFTGEVLDVTGMLGGYNLHWAFASAAACARALESAWAES